MCIFFLMPTKKELMMIYLHSYVVFLPPILKSNEFDIIIPYLILGWSNLTAADVYDGSNHSGVCCPPSHICTCIIRWVFAMFHCIT